MTNEQRTAYGYKAVTKRSVLPIYAVGIVLLIYSLCFPLYRAVHFIAAILVASAVYLLLSALLPKKIVYVPTAPARTGDERTDSLMETGRKSLEQLRGAQAEIIDAGICQVLMRMEDVCVKIFTYLHENPGDIDSARMFLKFYLPTTAKMAQTYAKLEKQGADGENITETRTKISDALMRSCAAFEKQLDSLFSHIAMDISADISVMEDVMTANGLWDNN